jgi:hypothetical protein
MKKWAFVALAILQCSTQDTTGSARHHSDDVLAMCIGCNLPFVDGFAGVVAAGLRHVSCRNSSQRTQLHEKKSFQIVKVSG